jgi:hypothetical protein
MKTHGLTIKIRRKKAESVRNCEGSANVPVGLLFDRPKHNQPILLDRLRVWNHARRDQV